MTSSQDFKIFFTIRFVDLAVVIWFVKNKLKKRNDQEFQLQLFDQE